MAQRKKRPPEEGIDLAAAFGSEPPSEQVLAIYIPDKDKNGDDYGAHQKWIDEFSRLLAKIGGGTTEQAPARGRWINNEGKEIVETTVIAYTFIRPSNFLALLGELRSLLHKFGRDTNQGEVVLEFDKRFYRIKEFGPLEVK